MKQNPSPARFKSWQIPALTAALTLGVALLPSGCARLPQPPQSSIQTAIDRPREAGSREVGSRININSAGARDLESLPGIGKAVAERIIAYRDQYGPFRRAEHLMMVRGISDRKFRELRSSITIE